MKFPRSKELDRRLKLTAAQIRSIKRSHRLGQSKNALAKEYGVDNNTISYHVDPAYRAKHKARANKWNRSKWKHDPTFREKNRKQKRDNYEYRMKNDPRYRAYKRAQNQKKV